MGWSVETLDERVDAELEALPPTIRARVVRIAEMIEALGLQALREPHVKHLDGKLWEIRAKAKEGIGRAVYVTVTGRRVVIVQAFVKKTRKTPLKNMALARERAQEVL